MTKSKSTKTPARHADTPRRCASCDNVFAPPERLPVHFTEGFDDAFKFCGVCMLEDLNDQEAALIELRAQVGQLKTIDGTFEAEVKARVEAATRDLRRELADLRHDRVHWHDIATAFAKLVNR